MDLWQKLAIELDSLKLALQLTVTQKIIGKDFEHIKNYAGAHQQLDAVASFARRAAEIVEQLEKSGEIVRQKRSTDPISEEGEQGAHTLGNQAGVVFPLFNKEVKGKIDTGATTSSLHATDIRINNGRVSFKCELFSSNIITLPVEGTQEVHSADFGGDKRPIVRMDVEIDGVLLKGVMFNLNDRSEMDSKLLIGQDVLKAGNFQVDVNKNQEAPASEALPETLDEVYKPGTTVRVPHKGKMVSGKVVRYDKGEAGGSPFYVVDVGEYESAKVPAHKMPSEEATDHRTESVDIPESVREFHNKQLYEAVQLLVDNEITLADLVKYLRTEAVNRIKD